jgi:hypothetical protein
VVSVAGLLVTTKAMVAETPRKVSASVMQGGGDMDSKFSLGADTNEGRPLGGLFL